MSQSRGRFKLITSFQGLFDLLSRRRLLGLGLMGMGLIMLYAIDSGNVQPEHHITAIPIILISFLTGAYTGFKPKTAYFHELVIPVYVMIAIVELSEHTFSASGVSPHGFVWLLIITTLQTLTTNQR